MQQVRASLRVVLEGSSLAKVELNSQINFKLEESSGSVTPRTSYYLQQRSGAYSVLNLNTIFVGDLAMHPTIAETEPYFP